MSSVTPIKDKDKDKDSRPLWETCECCDDFLCNLHNTHAYDCECPDIDTFAGLDIFPYAEGSLALYAAVVEQQQGNH